MSGQPAGAVARDRVDQTVYCGTSSPSTAHFAAIERIAARQHTARDVELIAPGLAAWIRSGGTVPMERCLRLPKTFRKIEAVRRDYWLCAAAKYATDNDAWSCANWLRAEWEVFITRGPWHVWREEEEPPTDAAYLNRALFWATRLNRSESLKTKQILRICGHVFTKKCPR